MKITPRLLLLGCLLLSCLCHCTGPGLDKYKDMVVADVPAPPASGVRVTYLGVNGYLLQSRDATVIVDPYFTRIPALRYAFARDVKPDANRVAWGERRLPSHADLILVTHGHCDHLFDASLIALKTGATIVAPPTSCNLVRSLRQNPEPKLEPILSDPKRMTQQTRQFGNVKVQALLVQHDRFHGIELYPGTRDSIGPPPKRAGEWVAGETIAFIITMGGKRIFITAGMVHAPHQDGIEPVDLAIMGVATKDPLKVLAEAVGILQPRYVLPSHQDNFFIAPEKGFHFSSTSDFDAVLKALPEWKPGHNLILLDYFQPWTLQ